MSEPIQTKQCPHCKQTKPISEFYKNRNRKDRLCYWCKICARSYNQSKRGKVAINRYWHSEKGKTVYLRSRNRYKAKSAVGYAIVINKLSRPDSLQCFHCGKQAEQYHHISYEPKHWLDVIALCKKCHRKIHNIAS